MIIYNGEECYTQAEAMGAFVANRRQLTVFRRQGLPYYGEKGFYVYPKARGHEWFATSAKKLPKREKVERIRFDRLRRLSKEKKVSQKKLSEIAGKEKSYISVMKHHNAPAPYEVIKKWARVLGTTTGYLTGKEEMKPEVVLNVKGRNDTWFCLECIHVTNKYRACPWVNRFEPVEGWEAKQTIVKNGQGYDDISYDIQYCPLYESEKGERGKRK